MQTIKIDQKNLTEAVKTTVKVLRAGGLVLFPTETTYGAGVDALNQAAVNKLLAYKSRREGKPLSIAVTDEAMASEYVEINESARKVYQRFLPGPVTVISKSKNKVAVGVESEFGTLGIRVPDYAFVLEVVKKFGKPITATSANASGEKRPYTIQDIFDGLSEKQKNLVDLVIDAGELPHRPPSTVIDTTLSTPVVFRQGDVEIVPHQKATTLQSKSEQETKDIAKRIVLKHWNEVRDTGLLIGLNGSLGMGKTIFVKGIAEFLQIQDTITSPTYNYVQVYDFDRHNVRGTLAHFDVWKVEAETEMERLNFEKFLKPNTVVVVEWVSNISEYIARILPIHQVKYLEVEFSGQAHQRQLTIKE